MKKMVILFALSALLVPLTLNASTVMEMTLEEVSQDAVLIFEGQVIKKEVRIVGEEPFAKSFTYFTFEIFQVIKGYWANETIEIGFMGGPMGDMELIVSDMRMPEADEHGIYFLETLQEQQVNPLLGWHQGHYLVIPHNGQEYAVPVTAKIETYSNNARSLKVNPIKESFIKDIQKAIEGR